MWTVCSSPRQSCTLLITLITKCTAHTHTHTHTHIHIGVQKLCFFVHTECVVSVFHDSYTEYLLFSWTCNRLVFVMKMHFVFCEVWTGFSYSLDVVSAVWWNKWHSDRVFFSPITSIIPCQYYSTSHSNQKDKGAKSGNFKKAYYPRNWATVDRKIHFLPSFRG
jgi:hypothetical protein